MVRGRTGLKGRVSLREVKAGRCMVPNVRNQPGKAIGCMIPTLGYSGQIKNSRESENDLWLPGVRGDNASTEPRILGR